MKEFTQKDIERLVEEKGFWGFQRDWTLRYHSIQNMAWRMMVREAHSFHTFRRFMEGVKHFVEFLGASDPDDALERVRRGNATEIIDKFIGKLTASGLYRPTTIKSIYYGVKKWLDSNKVKVDWNYIARPKVAVKLKDRIPSKEELRRILNFAHIRDKALFMVMLSSGLRVGTAMRLRLKDYEPYEDLGIIHVEGGEGKKLSEGFWYWTFITPEARKVLEQYLEWRRMRGDKLAPESPLFARIDAEKPFGYSANVTKQWRRLLRKAGLSRRIEGHDWNELHLHTLRKFFHTQCKAAGIRRDYYDFWMGHTQGLDLADSYWREEIPRHVAEYRKAIPYLSIYETPSIDEVEMRKRQILDMVRLLMPEKFETVKNALMKVKSARELDSQIQNLMIKIKRKNEVEEDSEDCEKVISESELEKYLARGWRFKGVLPSGKILIRKTV